MDRVLQAKTAFEAIRDRPYRVTTERGVPADNCHHKTKALSDAMISFGYAVRIRVGEIDWADMKFLPPELHQLRDPSIVETHFFLEIDYGDGEWKILDPSWHKKFAERFNLPWSEFGGQNRSCFDLKRVYDPDEQFEFEQNLADIVPEEDLYMRVMSPFLTKFNLWMEECDKTTPIAAMSSMEQLSLKPGF